MRKFRTAMMIATAALLAAACGNGSDPETTIPSMEISVSDVSASGCVVAVTMGANTESYCMKVYPESAFDERLAMEELPSSMPYTQTGRIIERLSGPEKDYRIAAIPLDGKGKMGKLVSTGFKLTQFDLSVNLYAPGEGVGADLNKFNTLNVDAYSNGLAAAGRLALALNASWRALKDLKGLKGAAEEVFSTAGVVDLTLQQLEDMADRTKYKKDVMYFTSLEAGTKYTLVVRLEDLDGESHYYDFDGSTAPAEQ